VVITVLLEVINISLRIPLYMLHCFKVIEISATTIVIYVSTHMSP